MRDLETIEPLTRPRRASGAFDLHTLDATETITRIVSSFPSHQAEIRAHPTGGNLESCDLDGVLVRAAKRFGAASRIEVMGVSTGLIRDTSSTRKNLSDSRSDATARRSMGWQAFDQSLFKLLSRGLISLGRGRPTTLRPGRMQMRVWVFSLRIAG